jgi:hypothetical protein
MAADAPPYRESQMTRSSRIIAAQSISPQLQLLRVGGLVILCAIPLVGFLFQPLAGRLVWNLVSLLPLIIVLLGYPRWRRVCPLYLLTRLPAPRMLKRGHRAPKWLEAHAYYLSFGLFVGSIWLRLVGLTSDGRSIAIFFIVLAAGAVTIDCLFTGRTWCNYFCPLSFVEKVYTEASSFGKTANSPCTTCTGCKKACPDIDQESSYRIEMPLAAKRFIYFAFPGAIVGFYAYSCLQSGSWHALLGAQAPHQAGFIGSAFLPGHNAATAGLFFLPQLPRVLAAALTLGAGSLISFAALSAAERLLRAKSAQLRSSLKPLAIRHVLFAVAAFISFLTFYAFVGQTLFGTALLALEVFELSVVTVAITSFANRLRRTPVTTTGGEASGVPSIPSTIGGSEQPSMLTPVGSLANADGTGGSCGTFSTQHLFVPTRDGKVHRCCSCLSCSASSASTAQHSPVSWYDWRSRPHRHHQPSNR